MNARRTTAIGVMAAGAAVTVAGSLLPWVRTGGRRRHSYDLFAVVGRLGFAPDGLAAIALRWWPLVPALSVAGIVLASWDRPVAGAATGIAAATYAGGVALAVLGSGNGAVDVLVGVPVTLTGAVVLGAGSLAVLTSTVHARRGCRGARPDGR